MVTYMGALAQKIFLKDDYLSYAQWLPVQKCQHNQWWASEIACSSSVGFLPVHVAEITAGCIQIPQDYYIWNIELGNDVIIYIGEFINFLRRVYWLMCESQRE